MQLAANMPLLLMCHDDERKHASIVYQFHSICHRSAGIPIHLASRLTLILQALSPISIPPMSWLEAAEDVADAAADVAVTVMLAMLDMDMDIELDIVGTTMGQ